MSDSESPIFPRDATEQDLFEEGMADNPYLPHGKRIALLRHRALRQQGEQTIRHLMSGKTPKQEADL